MLNLEQIAIAADQLINTLVGGMADETLSARAHRQRLKGRTIPANLIDAIFFWQKEHCLTAYMSEVDRKQLPSAYRW